MKLRNEKSIAIIYDAVSISKGLDVVTGSLKQNYYAESATYVPDRFVFPLVLRPRIEIADPNKSIPDGDKVDEVARLEWFLDGVKINSNDEFKIEGVTLKVFKNSEEPFVISYRAEWLDPRKKQIIVIEDSLVVSCISLAQNDADATMSLSKPQNWVHNPLKGERVYTINAYVSKGKVYESAVEWYYVNKEGKDVLIDDTCDFYVDGQFTNALNVDSSYMENVVIKAKNISNDKLKEIYWFFDKHGNPVTHKTPEKTEVKGANVFSLPSSPTVAKLGYRINGLTLTNLLKNEKASYKLVDGTANYDYNGGVISYEMIAGSWTGLLYKDLFNLKEGDKYFIMSAFKYPKDGVKINLGFSKRFGEGDVFIVEDATATTKINDFVTASSIIDITESGSGFLRLRVNETIESELVYIKPIACINLTQTFGAGNEPAKEWCDEHISGYFEGTKSVAAPLRIKSVGENLFNIKDVIPDGTTVEITESGYVKGPNSTLGITINLNLKPNTDYKFGYSIKEGLCRSFIKDLDSDEIIQSNGMWKDKVINSKSGNLLWSFSTSTSDAQNITEVSDIYVTSSINKQYTPYTESNLYLNSSLELKSVGEVKDYIESGKLYKNVTDWYKINDGYTTKAETQVGGYFVYNTTMSAIGVPDQEGNKLKYVIINKNEPQLLFPSPSGTWGGGKNMSILSNLETVEEVRNEWKNNEYYISFQKATPEIINLNTSGSFQSYPNGTIFIEPATLVEQQYNDGLQVDLPIKTLESIKVGTEYLDVSKAVVKENLITHPDIENGDFVTIEYIYDDSPIYGTNSIGYLSLEEILDDLWLDNVYTYKITNGEWELVKVTDIEDYEEWLKTEKTSPYSLAPDGVVFGKYQAETKFIRQYPSSLYVDFIAPTRLKEGVSQIKARALVGTRDGVLENPSKYFLIKWYKRSTGAGQVDLPIGEGNEIIIDVADKDMIGIEIESIKTK